MPGEGQTLFPGLISDGKVSFAWQKDVYLHQIRPLALEGIDCLPTLSRSTHGNRVIRDGRFRTIQHWPGGYDARAPQVSSLWGALRI